MWAVGLPPVCYAAIHPRSDTLQESINVLMLKEISQVSILEKVILETLCRFLSVHLTLSL